MQQPHITSYAEIGEVRTVTGAAACNQLLAEGWVLLGTYPLTTVADMEQQPANGGRKQDIQRYVRRLVRTWWKRYENRNARQLLLYLPLPRNTMNN